MFIRTSQWFLSSLLVLCVTMLMLFEAGCAAPRLGWQSTMAIQSDGPIGVTTIDALDASTIVLRPAVAGFYYYRSMSARIPVRDQAPTVIRHHSNRPMNTWPATFVPKGSAFVIEFNVLYELWRGEPTASSSIPSRSQLPVGTKLTIRMEYVESEDWPVSNALLGKGTPFSIEITIL